MFSDVRGVNNALTGKAYKNLMGGIHNEAVAG